MKTKKKSKATTLRTGRIALVGRPNVGKSTLLNALIGERISIVSHHPQTTRDELLGIHTTESAQFLFLDTPGIFEGKHSLASYMLGSVSGAMDSADVVVFVTDAGERVGAIEKDKKLLLALPTDKPCILAINKIDKTKAKSALFPLLQKYAELRPFEAIVPISARREDGLEPLLAEMEKLLPESVPEFDRDELTDKPARFFAKEFIREQILRNTEKEVPHGVAVVVESFEDEPKITKLRVTVHVDKESHKRIVIGKGGQLLKRIGTEARKRLEEMLAKQVHLELWVRVSPKWYESTGGLFNVGYGSPQ
ncbi:MAG: GTPase Era [Polyangiaceae bacterium]|nr:GTPase Era [Polyangiaceae bacterium]